MSVYEKRKEVEKRREKAKASPLAKAARASNLYARAAREEGSPEAADLAASDAAAYIANAARNLVDALGCGDMERAQKEKDAMDAVIWEANDAFHSARAARGLPGVADVY